MGTDRFRFTLNNTTEGSIILLASTQNEPNGWEEVDIIFRRDERLHGVFFEFSTPFKFVRRVDDSTTDGFTYLKNIYDTQGIGAIITIDVEYRPSQFDTFTTIIEGRINMTNAQFDLANNEVTVNIEDNSDQAQFLALADNKIDLTTEFTEDGTTLSKSRYNVGGFVWAPREVNVQSKTIRKTNDLEIDPIISILTSTFTTILHIVPANTPSSVFNFTDRFEWAWNKTNLDELDTLEPIADLFVTPNPGTSNPLYTATQDGTLNIDLINFSFVLVASHTFLRVPPVGGINSLTHSYVFQITKNNTTVLFSDVSAPTNLSNLFSPILNAAISTPVVVGDTIEIFVVGTASFDFNNFDPVLNDTASMFHDLSPINLNSQIKISQDRVSPDSPVNGYAIHESLNMLSTVYTNNALETYSKYFGRRDAEPSAWTTAYTEEGCGALNVLFNGLGLRGFPNTKGFFVDSVNANPPSTENKDHKGTFVSWNEMFDALNAIFNLGATFRDDPDAGKFVIRIEERNFFYPNTSVITLDNVDFRKSGWRQIVDESRYFNEIEIGYAKWENEDFSGLDEYNTKHTYRTGLTVLKNKISLLSSFVSGGYAIELTRQKQFTQTRGIDDEFDDEMFILNIDPSQWPASPGLPPPAPPAVGSAIDSEQGIVGGTNVIDPLTAINWRINPHYNLIRFLSWLAQGERILLTKIFATFQDAVGNYAVTGSENAFPANPSCNFGTLNPITQTEQANNGRVDPFVVPELIEMSHDLSYADYLALKASPLEQILISDTDQNHDAYYLKELRYRIAKQQAQWTLIPKRPAGAFAFGNALRFNQNVAPENDYVDLTTNAIWNNIFEGGGTPDWSISFWVNSFRTGTLTSQTLMGMRNTSAPFPNNQRDPVSIFFRRTAGKMEPSVAVTAASNQKFEVRANDGTITEGDGLWHHIVITHKWSLQGGGAPETGIEFYIDGVQVVSKVNHIVPQNVPFFYQPTTNPMEMGATTGIVGTRNVFLAAIIDELAIYNREITPAEVAQLYNAGAGSFANVISGIQVYYRMESTAVINPLTMVDEQGAQDGDLPVGIWGASGDWTPHI